MDASAGRTPPGQARCRTEERADECVQIECGATSGQWPSWYRCGTVRQRAPPQAASPRLSYTVCIYDTVRWKSPKTTSRKALHFARTMQQSDLPPGMVVTLSAESDRCRCCGRWPSRLSRTRGPRGPAAVRSSLLPAAVAPRASSLSPWQQRRRRLCCGEGCCGGGGGGCGGGCGGGGGTRGWGVRSAGAGGRSGGPRETRSRRPLLATRRPLRHGPDRLQHSDKLRTHSTSTRTN